MLGFLNEYGNIAFSEMPLCDADRLIFAQLVYLDISAAGSGTALSEALAEVSFAGGISSEVRFGFQTRDDIRLRDSVCAARRYSDIRLCDFTRISDAGTTFAAMTLEMPDGLRLIVFRGTDNSLAGWKEDFDLAYRQEIPSHRLASDYALRMARDARAYELIGHSKGGHLALYAASGMGGLSERLRTAVSFDGPGFSREMLDNRDFSSVSDRICVLVPRSSVVGLLFEQPVEKLIVESRMVSLLQHYPYFWKIRGGGFMVSPEQTQPARIFGKTVQGLMNGLSLADREKLIESVYEIICATKAETLNDIVRGWFTNTIPVARALIGRDRDTYKLFIRTIMAFLRSAAKALNYTEDK